MVERGKGTILFTGCSASLNGIAGFSELCKNFLYKEITLFKSFISIYIIRQLLVYLPPTYTGCGKFALRALSQCLASEFQSQGVHVAHVIIDGVIGPPRLVI
jgi:NAD(P)-dependent dehydrogenase (short-subunit alcohol dehydrogenase family)